MHRYDSNAHFGAALPRDLTWRALSHVPVSLYSGLWRPRCCQLSERLSTRSVRWDATPHAALTLEGALCPLG